MPFLVKSDLDRFYDKLNKYKGQGDLALRVADKITETGKNIALQNWGSSATIDVVGDGLKRSIVARDPNKMNPTIAYLEFGTGVLGKGTYKGKLPTKYIWFKDLQGVQWRTKGWVYYYRYKQTKQGRPFTGQPAKMPMFITGQELREYIRTDLKKDIKGD